MGCQSFVHLAVGQGIPSTRHVNLAELCEPMKTSLSGSKTVGGSEKCYKIKLTLEAQCSNIQLGILFQKQPFLSSEKHVHAMTTPLNPTLYSKTGVCRGVPIFLIFGQKHRLWVLIRTASSRLF